MTQLTIEHLACYLPYGLKIKCSDTEEIMDMSGLSGSYTIEAVTTIEGEEYARLLAIDKTEDGEEYGIPYLRQLSQLTQEIEHNGERFVPIVELAKIWSGSNDISVVKGTASNFWYLECKMGSITETMVINESLEPWYQSYFERDRIGHNIINIRKGYEYLYSLHFDIFGLLEQGLALPIQ